MKYMRIYLLIVTFLALFAAVLLAIRGQWSKVGSVILGLFLGYGINGIVSFIFRWRELERRVAFLEIDVESLNNRLKIHKELEHRRQ